MEVLFWLLVAMIVYVYAGYPLLLVGVRAARGARPVAIGAHEPAVTLIVSAFNEAAVIAEKLRNSLAIDYPCAKLDMLVVSDASEDGTDDIVRQYSGEGVRLLTMQQRGGKTLGLNAGVNDARGEIVVFSDANAMYAPDAIRNLVRNFADPSVGAVVGESTYTDADAESERSEGLYWRYETFLKRLESQIGSVVGGDGAIYAIRKDLYVPMRADALSDFVNPLQIVRNGHRCVYEPQARSFERAADSFNKEFRRKVRIVNRAWRALLGMKALLNPLRHRFFSVALISHKLLRWLVPGFMALVFLINLSLLDEGAMYRLIMAAQIAFYLLAAAGHVSRRRRSMPALLSIPYYFCLVNLASALGVIDAFRGRTYTTWATARAGNQ